MTPLPYLLGLLACTVASSASEIVVYEGSYKLVGPVDVAKNARHSPKRCFVVIDNLPTIENSYEVHLGIIVYGQQNREKVQYGSPFGNGLEPEDLKQLVLYRFTYRGSLVIAGGGNSFTPNRMITSALFKGIADKYPNGAESVSPPKLLEGRVSSSVLPDHDPSNSPPIYSFTAFREAVMLLRRHDVLTTASLGPNATIAESIERVRQHLESRGFARTPPPIP